VDLSFIVPKSYLGALAPAGVRCYARRREMARCWQVKMIAIVDDDSFVRQATQSLLRSVGYGAVTFASAEEFLQSDQIAATSCLITDVQMPGLSGVELQSILLAQGYRMPMIFVTASVEEKTRTRALKAGAMAFLAKPFSVDRLIDYVHRACTGRSVAILEV
jgi:FixJ family two-component response regulator